MTTVNLIFLSDLGEADPPAPPAPPSSPSAEGDPTETIGPFEAAGNAIAACVMATDAIFGCTPMLVIHDGDPIMFQPITRIFDGKTFYQIPGFVDYWISADDEVISDKGRTHYLKVHFGYHGYYRVHLQHSDHKTFPNLHRLKIMAMITGPLRFDQKVDHIDGNPRNNRLENLQILDNTENMRKCPFTVLTEADATQIPRSKDTSWHTGSGPLPSGGRRWPSRF